MSLGNFVKRFSDITRIDAGINGDAQRIEQLTWMLFLKVYDQLEDSWDFERDDYKSIIPPGFHWKEWADTNSATCRKGEALLDFVNNELFPTLQYLELPPGCPRSQAIVKTVFEDIHNYAKDGVAFRQCLELINDCDFDDPEESHAFGTVYETILRSLQSAGNAGEFYTPRALTDFIAGHVDLKIGDSIADFACGTGGFLNSARKYLDPFVGDDVEKRDTLNHAFFGIEKKPLPYLLCVTNMLLNKVEEPNIQHGNSLTRNVDDYTAKDCFDVILMNPPYGGSEKFEIQQNFPQNMRSAETADLFMILIMARLKENGGRAAVVVPDGFLFGTGNKAVIKETLLRKFNLHTIVRLPTSVFSPYTSIATNILFFNGVPKDEKKGAWATEKTWFYRVDMPEGYKHFSKTKPMLLEHLKSLDAWWSDRKDIEENGFFKAKAFSPEELAALGFNFDLCGWTEEEEEILPPKELIAKYQAEREACEKRMDAALQKILSMIEGAHE